MPNNATSSLNNGSAMTDTSAFASKVENVNRLGLTMDDYKGAVSTLCAGCGHNSVTNQIIKAYFELGIQPHLVAKVSGIGCSSRTPAFFLDKAHGFNGAHGRMPPVATGAALANHNLHVIGISGDGDTASIGMSHFIHTLRRNTDMVYIIEDNGVYSLTKGQFSATADVGSTLHNGEVNEWMPIDCCGLAIEMGCGCVGRSFSGDTKQLHALLKIAFRHKGTSVIVVVSPCVTFNNHDGSTKSYKRIKNAAIPLHEINFIDATNLSNTAKIAEDKVCEINMGDGGIAQLKNLEYDYNYDPTDRRKVLLAMERARQENLFLTGLLYYDKSRRSLREQCNLVDEPLATLPVERVRPSKKAFEEIIAAFA
ncbi:MAG: 2-oxoacid:ferredoxin oxidoreductase subunit beta [Planctomycetota bacterium]